MTDIRRFFGNGHEIPIDSEMNDLMTIEPTHIQSQPKPSAKGQKWSDAEELQLLQELETEISISDIADIHDRTYGGITSRMREIAYKMINQDVPMSEVIQKTKLNEFQINDTIEKKEYSQKKREEKKIEKHEQKKENHVSSQKKKEKTSSGEDILSSSNHLTKIKTTQQLSIEQECALQQFENRDNLFVTGEGGTGKTLLIQYLVRCAKLHGRKIQVCALTGCASLLLECNAKTIHSWSGIRLGKGDVDDIVGSVIYNHAARNSWRNTDVLIVDEVSMMSKRIFEILDIVGRRVRKCYNKPFGGLQVVFVGDFFQLPPVTTSNFLEGEDSFCFESDEWLNTFPLDNHIVLKTIFRQDDNVFRRILGNIRMGTIVSEDVEVLKTYLNRTFDHDKYQGIIPTKLYPTKNKVDAVNREMFRQLEGESYTYQFVSKTNCRIYMDGTEKEIPASVLSRCRKNLNTQKTIYEIDSLANSSPCVKTLELKKGANVMCTVNLDLDNGVCNGSIGKVIDFIFPNTTSNDTPPTPVPIVLFSNGHRMIMAEKYWQSEDYPSVAVGQYPLCLAWAMTIHKIQGATLSMAEIDIGRGIFECGQTYVALSRVKNLDGLYLSNFEPDRIKTNQKVKSFYEGIPEVEYEEEEEEEKQEKQEKQEEQGKIEDEEEVEEEYINEIDSDCDNGEDISTDFKQYNAKIKIEII